MIQISNRILPKSVQNGMWGKHYITLLTHLGTHLAESFLMPSAGKRFALPQLEQ
jgi:hypothetical protein